MRERELIGVFYMDALSTSPPRRCDAPSPSREASPRTASDPRDIVCSARRQRASSGSRYADATHCVSASGSVTIVFGPQEEWLRLEM